MSAGNVVDSKVVELQFDNQNFESNATKSLSTLERLKTALNFSKDTKGFDEVAKSAKSFDISNVTSGVESLRFSLSNIAKISAFRVISDQASQAFESVKQLGNELSQLNGFKGIMAGFDKYSSKTEAVQTIMAATAKDFSDTAEQMAVVNTQLDKLNWFTDETSYSFLDMVNNIGKFTSNNIALDKSVTAMEGISTWAAKSGAKVSEAGRAMYNLSQAIAVGSVKLMDWKSIENANMATAEFKETAMETAAEVGTLTKVTDGLYKTAKGTEVSVQSFNQTLSESWFTSEVLMDTLGKYGEFTDKLHGVMEQVDVDTTSTMLQYVEEFKKGTLDIDKAAQDAGVSAAKMKELLTELADPAMEFGMKAFKAAQEAKTFEEAIDATKDAVSTGWMNTWEIIFGDYEHAKGLWTNVANDLWDIFASGGEARNDYLREAFQTEQAVTQDQWDSILDKGIVSPAFINAVRKSAAEHGASIKEMAGDEEWLAAAIGKGLISVEDLEAGYSAVFGSSGVSKEVDESLKSQVESLKDSSEEFRNLFDILEKNKDTDVSSIIFGDGSYTEGYEELEGAMDSMLEKLGLTQADSEKLKAVLQSMGYLGGDVASSFDQMSDAQLKEIGWTDKQIEAFRKAKESGEDLHQVLDDIAKQNMTGQELFAGGIHNALSAIANVVANIRENFFGAFDGLSASGFRDILQGFYDGTAKLADFAENSELLKNAFKALGTIGDMGLKIISSGLTILGKGLSVVTPIVAKLVDWFNKGITAITGFIAKTDLIGKATTFITGKLDKAASKVSEWVNAFTKMPIVERNVNRFKTAFTKTFSKMPELFETAKTGWGRFTNALKNGSRLKKLSFSDIADNFKANVLDPIANSEVFAPISAAFSLLKSDIKQKLVAAGVDVDGITAKFKAFGDCIKTVFGFVTGTVTDFFVKIPGMIQQFKELPIVSNVLDKIGKGFELVKSKSGTFFTEAGVKFKGFLNNIAALKDNFTLENVGKAFEALKATLKDIWDSENNPFKDIIEGAKNLGGEIAGKFVNFKGLDNLKKAFEGLKTAVSDFFSGKIKLSDIGKTIDSFKESVTDTFGNTDFAKAIGDFFDLSGVGEKITAAFEKVKAAVSGFLSEHGIDIEGIKAKFTEIKDAILGIFSDFKIPKSFDEFFSMFSGSVSDKASEIDGSSEEIEKSESIFIRVINAIVKGVTSAASVIDPAVDAINSTFKKVLNVIILFAVLNKGVLGALSAWTAETKAAAKMQKAQARAITVISFLGAIYGVLLAVNLINKMKPGELVGGLITVGLILGMLVGVSALLEKFGGKKTLKSGVGVLSLVMSILGIMLVIKLLEHYRINWETIMAIVIKLPIVLLALAGVMYVTNAIGKNAKGAEKSILAMVAAVAAMMLVIWLLGNMDIGTIVKGTLALLAISAILAGLMYVSKFAQGSAKSFFALGLLAIAISVAISSLADIPTDKLAYVTGALSIILGMMTLLEFVASKATGAIPGLVAITVVFGIVAGVIALMTLLDTDKVMTIAVSLSLVFAALGIAMVAIATAGNLAATAAPGLTTLGIVFGILTAVIVALAALNYFIPDLGTFLQGGIDLLVQIGEGLGRFVGAIIGGGLEEGMSHLPVIGQYLTDFMTNLSGLNSVGTVDVAPLLEALLSILGISIVGFADSVLSIVSELTSGKSAAEQLGDDLTAVSTAMVTWQTNMSSISSLGEIDFTPLVQACGAVLGVSIVGFADSVLSLVSELTEGKSAAEQFGEDLTALGEALATWQSATEGLDIEVDFSGIAELAAAVGAVSFEGLFLAVGDAITSMISGKTQMETFRDDTQMLSDAIVGWKEKMEAVGEIEVPSEGIDDIVEAINAVEAGALVDALTEKAVQLVSGKSKMERFAENTAGLATALGEWKTKMDEIGTITVPKDAIDKLVEALKEIPKEGGLFGVIDSFLNGAPNFDSFKEQLGKLGEGIKGFTDALGTDLNTETLTTAATAVTLLGQMGTDLKGQDFGGWFHEGDMTLFGNELVTLGQKLQEFAAYEIDTEKLSSLADSAQTLGTFGKFVGDISISEDNVTGLETAITKLQTATQDLNAIDLSSSDIMDTGKVNKFKTNVETMITAIKEAQNVKGGVSGFIDAIDEINGAALKAAQSAQNQVNDVDVDTSDVGNKMTASTAKGVSDSADAVTGAMNDVIAQAAELAGAAADQFNNVGVGFMTSMMLGITMTGSIVSTAVEGVVSSAVSSASAYNDQFESAGSNMVQGLANGISNNASAAINAAAQVARDALARAKAELDIKSPSRKMMEVGNFFVEGFAKGIRDNTYHAVAVSRDLASEALSSFKGASEAIRDILTGDFDGDPVIRPVLDLSNVEAGSHRLSDMFNSRMPIGVSTNVRAINGSMSDRNAVSNMDILDALNRLNSNLSNVKGGDTFQVNGITYDDGSNISTAVRDLIRTVRVGRRM